MMNPKLDLQIDRLQNIFTSIGFELPEIEGADKAEINRLEEITGISLTTDIADFYGWKNGSNHELIFAIFTDELTPCEFLSLSQATESWRYFDQNPEKRIERINRQYKGYQQTPPRDKRIRPDRWANLAWFPFGEFNGGATKIYLDMDPTQFGSVGQVIAYQHDPDAIYFIAEDFPSFLKKSNDLLQEHADELFL
jgi:cell wall assembly regulator SMI1